MDVLVVGGSGLLGLRLIRQARLAGHRVIATCHTSIPPAADGHWRRADIRNRDETTTLALSVRPEIIFNAAYRQSDWETTADGAMNVALAAAAAGSRLVHVSSDAVFSGAAPQLRRDLPRPIPCRPTVPPRPRPRRRSRASPRRRSSPGLP